MQKSVFDIWSNKTKTNINSNIDNNSSINQNKNNIQNEINKNPQLRENNYFSKKANQQEFITNQNQNQIINNYNQQGNFKNWSQNKVQKYQSNNNMNLGQAQVNTEGYGQGVYNKFDRPKTNNVTFIDECNHESLRAIYGASKSVINVNASNGACERAFDSLSAGAMLISEESTQMEKLFGFDNSAILFKPNHAHSKMGQIKEIIRSGQSTDIALKGTSKFLAKHTWQDRSLYLSSIFSELLQKNTSSTLL